MPKAPFSARAWRRPVGGSILPRITRIPAKFTVPGPFGHEIGQLADAMTRRARDRSPDAMGVVPNGGGTTPIAIVHAGSATHRIKAVGPAAGPVGKHHRRPHIPAMWPMLPEPESVHHGTEDRPRTPAPAKDTTRPIRARARSVAVGRSVMKRTRIRRPRARSERPRLEALSPDPRDPDIVRAKALARTARFKLDQAGLLATKARCRYG
jgi:hypothetical protein